MDKSSTLYNTDSGYDKEVYENTTLNYFKILGMMSLFYIFMGFHWLFLFELGIHNASSYTNYNLIMFAINILVIAAMLYVGKLVNKKKLTHEFYVEKISEERQR